MLVTILIAGATISAAAGYLISVFAAGPFTISPAQGSYTGGETITITGNNFAGTANYDFRSYVAPDDMYIQLDAIQNRRGAALANGTTMTGNVAAGATDNGYFWHDLACTGSWSYTPPSGGSVSVSGRGVDANCYDWIARYTTGNQPSVITSGSGKAIASNANSGFQISGNLNLGDYLTTGTGTNSKNQFEVYHRAPSTLSTAAIGVVFEYGTANNTNPGIRFMRYASAAGTANLTNCFTNQGNALYNHVISSCANNTNWRADSMTFTRNNTANNGNSNAFYSNGVAANNSPATSTTAMTNPAASNNWFIGRRNITTTNGSSNTGFITMNSARNTTK